MFALLSRLPARLGPGGAAVVSSETYLTGARWEAIFAFGDRYQAPSAVGGKAGQLCPQLARPPADESK
jgi:hypothetical protein